jgi:hypothetical protein
MTRSDPSIRGAYGGEQIRLTEAGVFVVAVEGPPLQR